MSLQKVRLTKKEQKLFNSNFNRRAYERAKKPIQEAVSTSGTFEELWDKICSYERDVDHYDDSSIIYCEAELDRSHMKTEADYVGIDFHIRWDATSNTGKIIKASLHSSDTIDGEVELICFIDPETCAILEWVYDEEDDL